MLEWGEIPGWFLPADGAIYEKWARECPTDAIIVELGSYLGRSTHCLLSALDHAGKVGVTVVAVDIFWTSSLADTARNLSQWGWRRLRIVQDYVDQYAARFANGNLWGVYIDTFHNRNHILRDVQAWLPKIVPGGRIGGHDYTEHWPELVRYIDETFPVHNVYGASWEAELSAETR